MADGKDILILAEHSGGSLDSSVGELAAAAKGLAEQTGGQVVAALCGSGASGLAQEIAALGVAKVYEVDNALLADAGPEATVIALEAIVKAAAPAVVLTGKTVLTREASPRLAFRLGTGIAQDCVAVKMDGDALVADRPVYGGASVARVAVRSTPAVATLRANAFEADAPDASRQAEVVSVPVDIDASAVNANVTGREVAAAAGVRLEDARVVISGGRGLGGSEAFEPLRELAGLLAGAVGASRAVCDAGWLPYAHQVGLTGKTVSAEVYIAIAISGASQHLAGLSTVKNIVAVNRDAEANIFKEARYGVVGDWEKVTNGFLETVRKLVGS